MTTIGADLIRIREIPENSTYYLLELDGTPLAATIAGNRVKKFYSRTSLDEARDNIIREERSDEGNEGNEGENEEDED